MLCCQNGNHLVQIQEGSNSKLKLAHVCTEYSQFEQRKYTTTTTETLIEACNITRP